MLAIKAKNNKYMFVTLKSIDCCFREYFSDSEIGKHILNKCIDGNAVVISGIVVAESRHEIENSEETK